MNAPHTSLENAVNEVIPEAELPRCIVELLDAQPTPANTLPSGRSVSATSEVGGEWVRVFAPGGRLELAIELRPEGARLHVAAVEIALESRGALRARCERFEVDAREEVSLAGDRVTALARRGDVRLEAADDFRARGERVFLNCDDPAEVPDWMQGELKAGLRDVGGVRKAPGRAR